MLNIWGRISSINVRKVVWCAQELGLDFQRTEAGGRFGVVQTPEYLTLNPNAMVPTIDDGEGAERVTLWESNVIVRYLCARHSHGTFYPSELPARFDAERWMDWQQTTVAAPMGVLFRAHLRTPRDAIEPAALDAARDKAIVSWEILDRALANRPYVGGDKFTIGDIALGNAIHRWNRLPIERPALERVQGWYERLCERPAYRQYVVSVL